MPGGSPNKRNGFKRNVTDSTNDIYADDVAVLALTDVLIAPKVAMTSNAAIKSSSPSAGIGYATGAGSTVTQITNRSTGVTINALCGTITTDTTSLAAAAEATFTVTNSSVAINDVIILNARSGQANAGGVTLTVSAVAAGSFDITVGNTNASAETGAIIINFAVIKGVVS